VPTRTNAIFGVSCAVALNATAVARKSEYAYSHESTRNELNNDDSFTTRKLIFSDYKWPFMDFKIVRSVSTATPHCGD